MSSTAIPRRPFQSGRAFQSAREACRHVLRNSRTTTGRFIPVSVPDMLAHLAAAGFPVTECDVEAFLRELAASGEAVEIDAQAGFRWMEPAA